MATEQSNDYILESIARSKNILARLGASTDSLTKTGRDSVVSKAGTNFSSGGDKALQDLINQLVGGGTPEQQASRAKRNEEITTVRGQRADYSKAAAFADAQGAMSQQQRKALEELIPQLTRSAEGAGTSQSSLRALMIQDAANKAAESSAALGLKASVDYGQIGTNLSSILEALTRQDNPQTKALLEAIQLSKGQNSETTGNGSINMPASTGGGVNSNRMGPVRASLLADTNYDRNTGNMSSTGDFNGNGISNEFASTLRDNILEDVASGNGKSANAWSSFTF
jgi:hypothetical protein